MIISRFQRKLIYEWRKQWTYGIIAIKICYRLLTIWPGIFESKSLESKSESELG